MTDARSSIGTFQQKPFPDLLVEIRDSLKTGILVAKEGKIEKHLFFQNGEPVASRSNIRKDLLGEVLCARGKISRAQLDEAILESRKETEDNFGQVLVKKGFVTAKDLYSESKFQFISIVFSLFPWQEGTYSFQEGDPVTLVPAGTPRFQVKFSKLLSEGIRLIKNEELIDRLLGPLDQEVRPTSVTIPSGDLSFKGHETAVLESVGPGRTIEDTIRVSTADRLMVKKIICALASLGAVTLQAPESVPLPDAEGPATLEAEEELPALSESSLSAFMTDLIPEREGEELPSFEDLGPAEPEAEDVAPAILEGEELAAPETGTVSEEELPSVSEKIDFALDEAEQPSPEQPPEEAVPELPVERAPSFFEELSSPEPADTLAAEMLETEAGPSFPEVPPSLESEEVEVPGTGEGPEVFAEKSDALLNEAFEKEAEALPIFGEEAEPEPSAEAPEMAAGTVEDEAPWPKAQESLPEVAETVEEERAAPEEGALEVDQEDRDAEPVPVGAAEDGLEGKEASPAEPEGSVFQGTVNEEAPAADRAEKDEALKAVVRRSRKRSFPLVLVSLILAIGVLFGGLALFYLYKARQPETTLVAERPEEAPLVREIEVKKPGEIIRELAEEGAPNAGDESSSSLPEEQPREIEAAGDKAVPAASEISGSSRERSAPGEAAPPAEPTVTEKKEEAVAPEKRESAEETAVPTGKGTGVAAEETPGEGEKVPTTGSWKDHHAKGLTSFHEGSLKSAFLAWSDVIRAAPAHAYSIQIEITSYLNYASRDIKEAAKGEDVFIVMTYFNEKPAYKVLCGIYEDRPRAEEALKKLSPYLKAQKPALVRLDRLKQKLIN